MKHEDGSEFTATAVWLGVRTYALALLYTGSAQPVVLAQLTNLHLTLVAVLLPCYLSYHRYCNILWHF